MSCQWERRNVREKKINLKENEKKKWLRMKTMGEQERKKEESKKM